MTSLLNVAPQEILLISHSVMLLDWSWVDQVFILISNVSCLLKRHFYGVFQFVCHAVVSICIRFSVVYVVNNCFHGISVCNFLLFTWLTIVFLLTNINRRKYVKLYGFKKKDRQNRNTLKIWLPTYLQLYMIIWDLLKLF